MYSKVQVKEFKQLFWTSFGKYMKKHQQEWARKTNWVNYKTKVKDVYFRLYASTKKVTFAIELQHKDAGIRELYYEQFTELKVVLNDNFEIPLTWDQEFVNEYDLPISKIGCELTGVNIYDKNTWQDAFVFMEKNMLSAHNFWTDYKEIFKQLE